MHPIIGDAEGQDRFMACKDLIEQLEECHKSGFLEKAMGKCTPIKQELTQCLHENRLAAERVKIQEKRKRSAQFQQKKKELFEEEYGEGGYLKKVIEMEQKEGKK